jgi:hypothetical protein
MTGHVAPSRRPSAQVRRTSVKRRSPGLNFTQILAVGLIAAFASAIVVVGMSPTFAVRNIQIHGATFTDEAVVRSIVGMDGKPNAFGLDSSGIAATLVRLPAVESVSVQVELPSTVVVNIVERKPRLVWAIGSRRFVVDENGLIFGLVDTAGNPIPSAAGPLPTPGEEGDATDSPEATDSPADTSSPPMPTASPTPEPTAVTTPTAKPKATPKPTHTKKGATGKATPSPTAGQSASAEPVANPSLVPSLVPAPTSDSAAESGPGALALPVVFDRRATDAHLDLGGVVDDVSLDAGYRIGSLTTSDLGSRATALAVVLDDQHGFTLSSVPQGWVADFGFYAPTVRKVTIIPTQVRDLGSALAKWGEDKVGWVFLVSDVGGNQINTVILR